MDILQNVAETITKYKLLCPGQNIIAGVSGGADSLCLLICLRNLGYQVTIAHLDHQLREESADEARYVETIGSDLGLETIMDKGDVRNLAHRGYSLEEAARLVRYRFLARVANERGVDTIATGHTADDQTETVLMHFLRGAGPSGLRGIIPSTNLMDWVDIPEGEGIRLVRPLLEIKRSDTEAYCRQMKLDPVQDPSNRDLSFFRNRIRHHLIPILREYNPGIEHVILRMAKVMDAEADMVDGLVQERWQSIVIEEAEAGIKIDKEAFLDLPMALQRSFIRRVIKQLRPDIRDIGFDHVERATKFLSGSQNYHSLPLLAGLEMVTFSKDIALIQEGGEELSFSEYPQIQSQTTLDVSVPSQIALDGGWKLQVEHKDLSDINVRTLLESLTNDQAALDKNSIQGKLRLRTVRPGDRITPLGMDGSLKVSDLFINNKIPQPARAKWPLIVDDEKVVWVVGLRIADNYRITSKTQEILFFNMMSPEEKRS